MKVEMTIEEKEFTTEKGDKIPYYDCTAKIGEATVKFVPKTESKDLLKFLLSSPNSNVKK